MTAPIETQHVDRLAEHRGGYLFKRAFHTTFAILTAVSAFIAAWLLIWGLTLGGLWGIGQSEGRQDGEPNMQDDPSISQTEPTSDPDCTPEPGLYDC